MSSVASPRNPFEQWMWGVLSKLKKKHNLEVSYESETLPYVLVKSYKPDFIVKLSNGHKIYIETKGYLRPTDRTKLLSVLRNNPNIDLRLVFQKNKTISKRSKTTYTEWCDKNNIKCAVHTLPKEWLSD